MGFHKEEIDDIRRRMQGLKGKAARAMAKNLAEVYSCDVTRIYHYSRDVRPGRKEREDKTRLRSITDDDLLKDMLALTLKEDFAAPHIRDQVRHNRGVEINPATYNRYLRQIRLSRRENKQNLNPYRSWEAEYPNQLHQIDTTVAQQFYLDDAGAFQHDKYYYKNKDVGKRPRLVLFQLVDDHSRVKFAMFMLNNNARAWLNALYHAWRRKDDLEWPFFGIPEAIYSDNDSVIKSKIFKQTMLFLGRGIGLEEGIAVKTHEVGNSQAKGKVEGGFKLLQEFEKITKIEKFKNVEDANDALWDFLYGYNSRRHGTTGEIPFQRWLRVDNEKLYNMPSEEIFARLQYRFERRQLRKDLTISLFGDKWQLPQKKPFINHVLKDIDVAYSPYDRSKIYVIIENKDYEIAFKERSVHGFGEFKAIEQNSMQKLKEEIEGRELPEWEYSGFYKDMYGKTFLPKAGQEFDGSSLEEEMPGTGTVRSRIWFMDRLQEEYLIETPPQPEEAAFVNALFPENEDRLEKELEDIISKLRSGEIVINRQTNSGVA